MKVLFYLNYALRALKRGGQRTVLAIVCIAFGVMSLVAMQLVADNFTAVVMTDPRAEIGGDFQLKGPDSVISSAQLAEIDHLQAEGVLDHYSPMADTGLQMMSTANGDMYLLDNAIGLDPQRYPLVGEVSLSVPRGAALVDLLRNADDAVITRDLADKLGLHVGDRFSLSARTGSMPTQFTIRGIVSATPDHRGDTVYFNLQAARRLSTWPDVVTQVSVTWSNSGSVQTQAAQLEAWRVAGWSITTPEDVINSSSRSQMTNVFGFMFRGAGILGLIVGGIGVATTLRVLLARRTLEIAMLKTLGYRKTDLIALFAVETLVLGATGGLVGAFVAVVISRQLTNLLARTGVMLFDYTADPMVIIGGVMIGIITSVVFGLYPIVSSSGVSPIALLRQLTDAPGQRKWQRYLSSLVLFIILGVLFTIVCGFIMNSIVEGVEVVVGGLLCLLVLGALLGAALTLVASVPWPGSRMMTLARTNLKRQRVMLVFPLLALFAGVFAIGLAIVTVYSANDRVLSHQLPDTGANMLVYARLQDEKQAVEQAGQAGVGDIHKVYQLPIHAYSAGGQKMSRLDKLAGYTSEDVNSAFALSGEPWKDDAEAVYVPYRLAKEIQVGQTMTLQSSSGMQRVVHLGGYYTVTQASLLSLDAGGVLAAQNLVTELGGDAISLTLTGTSSKDKLEDAKRAIRNALPLAIVVNLNDVNEISNRVLNNLLVFAIAVAGLALVAGAVLIANAVGLSMLQRQREMGILKAVGFSSADVLRMVALENSLLGFLAGIAGVAAVAIAVEVVNTLHPASQLIMSIPQVALLIVVSVLISGGVALATAWRPTQVRPMEVLRAE
jgi:putative ABC transport system permease protein